MKLFSVRVHPLQASMIYLSTFRPHLVEKVGTITEGISTGTYWILRISKGLHLGHQSPPVAQTALCRHRCRRIASCQGLIHFHPPTTLVSAHILAIIPSPPLHLLGRRHITYPLVVARIRHLRYLLRRAPPAQLLHPRQKSSAMPR